MGTEIERKFLVTNEDYKALATTRYTIRQGYIMSGKGRTVRIRIRNEQGFITIKGKSLDGGLARYEWEKEIPLQEAEELMQLCEAGRIEKHRYLVPNGNTTIEVDEFFGENEGLVIAEIELPTEGTPYERPPFLGEEITGCPEYYNAYLSVHPYKTWHR